MSEKTKIGRLHFIDAIRAWAILMMLQGHFVSALLSEEYRDTENLFFAMWSYFRGITAPVFFTIAGFIFTFILIRNFKKGWYNPRVRKGVIRGLQLIVIGYILQIRFGRLFKGTINDSFNIVHVLQCLGLSIILIVLIYLISFKFKRRAFLVLLCSITITLFFFKTEYEQWNYSFLPEFLSNYFTTANGSVFTIIPWFGFTSFGGFLAVIFRKYHLKPNFYRNAIISMILVGYTLVANSYEIIRDLKVLTGLQLFEDALQSSYLFVRLGVVLFIFSSFLFFRNYLTNKTILKIGQLTLPIYVLHAILLYNSITGYGLSRFYYHSLSPFPVIVGAICFLVIICLVVLELSKNKRLLNVLQW
jgi:uncharacterized membrane protein